MSKKIKLLPSKTGTLKKPTTIPISYIRRIIKVNVIDQNEGITKMSGGVSEGIAKATEEFIKYLVIGATKFSPRKSLLTYESLVAMVQQPKKFLFLRYIIPIKMPVLQIRRIIADDDTESELSDNERIPQVTFMETEDDENWNNKKDVEKTR